MATKEHRFTVTNEELPEQMTVIIPFKDTEDLSRSLTRLIRAVKNERRDVNRRLQHERNERAAQRAEEPRDSS